MPGDTFSTQRQQMVETQLRARGICDERVLAAMGRVPREEFIAPELREHAYADQPLPIGYNQTVSQPFIVAVTLEALALRPSDKVLEIGTGSGYQTALLAQLAFDVYSIERHPGLADSAKLVLDRLGYSNIKTLTADGTNGWPEFAPFDAIAVSAAAPNLPQPLVEQLREGGRMVIPVGSLQGQNLQLIRKLDGQPVAKILEGCRFVPLVGEHGYVLK
jgi:protein-L-isoaspartate(D-aspartate) O-methyltransferase